MQSTIGMKSVPADMLVFDELDEVTPDARALALERISHSDYKRPITAVPEQQQRQELKITPLTENPSQGGVAWEVVNLSGEDGVTRLFDTQGRVMREWQNRGVVSRIAWDGKDKRGIRVASGKYFLVCTAGRNKHTVSVVLQR